ncbi:long-chain fatty acid--CoA ligase [Nemorincola caseinilytica]|uniref:Long-chain fatty acid--CoA ligase n=1 Tax=Nemorincola caseinilytica TaxID=2054315 RepID=A0ABP8N8I7_9BACT
MIQRLFDIVQQRAQQTPDATMLAAKENGQWRTYPCKEVWETAQRMAGGLLSKGIANSVLEPDAQEKIAIISPNRPEWMITDVAVQLTGAVLTPVYPTISPTDLVYVLTEAEVRIVFVANADIYAHFKEALSQVPSLQKVYSFDVLDGVTHWTELLKSDTRPDEALLARIKPETLATIIYTSGTTGNPKGVMLTHNNIASNVRDSIPAFTFAHANAKALSFLPLNHIFERMVTYVYIHSGVSIYYAESMDTIGLNLKEVKPLVFTTVPRLLEKVYERIMNTAMELKGIKRALFFWALGLGKQYDNARPGSPWYRLQLWLANKIIFSKWREALGGNVKAIVTGSAACQERLARIFTSANIIIMEGYGLTETSPVISVNRFESENRRIGSIGTLIDNVEVKIAEDGEIMVKGPNVTIGYYKHPELTAAAMKDGWFLTGDIGQWIEGRFLKITDRKKEIFKTSGGKYVAPQAIENRMKESIYIEQMMVTGANMKFVAALIVPSYMQVRKYLRDHHPSLAIPENNKELIKLPEVMAIIQKQVDKYNEFFSHPEQVKKFALLADEWTIDSGELTPSLKVKRKAIEQRYARQIEELYTG